MLHASSWVSRFAALALLGGSLTVLGCGFPTSNGQGPDATVSADCGNGVHEPPAEACDDGNQTAGDGCENNCTLTVDPCGNMTVEPPEECDDGNQQAGDACNPDCTLPDPNCGNGEVQGELGEECDDSNTASGDGCDGNCTLSRCGNGVMSNDENGDAEACDDGNLTDGDGCDSNCTASECGNGIRAGNEVCDFGAANGTGACMAGPDDGATCASAATCAPVTETITFLSASGAGTSNDLFNTTVTGGAGAHRIVVVAVGVEVASGEAPKPDTITLGGVAMTEAEAFSASTAGVSMYFLTEADLPAEGEQVELVVEVPNIDDLYVAVLQFDGVAATGPDVVASGNMFDTNDEIVTTSITTVVNNAMLVDVVVASRTGSLSTGGNQTERTDVGVSSSQSGTSTRLVANASTVTNSWTSSEDMTSRMPHAILSLPPFATPVECKGCNDACSATDLP